MGVTGAVSVPGSGGAALKAQDEDALGFNRGNAAWSNFFDGSGIPGMRVEDVNALFIAGTEGSLSLPDLSLWRYEGERHWHQPIVREQRTALRADPYTRQLQHFAAVIRGEAAPLCSALDGLRTLQATRALLDAAASGQSVTCPVSTP